MGRSVRRCRTWQDERDVSQPPDTLFNRRQLENDGAVPQTGSIDQASVAYSELRGKGALKSTGWRW